MNHSIRLLACTLLATTTPLYAAVVDFETDDFDIVFDDGASRTVQGFDFTLQSGNSDAFFVSGLFAPGEYVNNGSKNLFAANYASLDVASTAGLSFDLKSFELGGSFVDSPEHWARSITVVGYTTDGLTLVDTFRLPFRPIMKTVSLNWTDLASFSILPTPHRRGDYNNRDYTIDNLDVTVAVPEPGSLALMFAGLGVVGWMARRRTR